MPRIRIEWEESDVLTGLYSRLNEINLTDLERKALEKILKRYINADAIRQRQLAHDAKVADKTHSSGPQCPTGTGF